MLGIKNLIKITSCGNDSEKIANLIYSGKFYQSDGLDVFNLGNNINWNYKHQNSSNTYQLYMHSLNLISFLCNGFELNKNKKYLIKAKNILHQWVNFDNSNSKKSKQAWCDHSVSSRAINIVYFYHICNGVIDMNNIPFASLLEKHAGYLADDRNYKKNNHGIMTDRALLVLAFFLKKHSLSSYWIEKSLSRLREAFIRDFSFQGVHLENSPDYHKIVHGKLFLQTEEFLCKFGYSLGDDIKSKIILGNKYYKYILKPDLYFPTIGDTSLGKMEKIKKETQSFYDPEAGIGILQGKRNNNLSDLTWISFVCGFSNKTHKHNDDLSFTLFYNSHDIFVDSGKYNYDNKDPIRKYMRSPLAHNTIAIEGENYSIDPNLATFEKLKITDYSSNKTYDYIKGINYCYNGSKLERSLLFIKPDFLIILDKFEGNIEKNYLQNFNLSPSIKIIDQFEQTVVLESFNSKIYIEQLAGFHKLKKYNGQKEKKRAIISEKFSQIKNTSQLEFSKKEKNGIFLTAIKMGEENNKVKKINYNEKNNLLSVSLQSLELSLII